MKKFDEILKVENDFCNYAKLHGIKEAFLEYADESAVIVRDNVIFKGKTGIEEYFNNTKIQYIELTWKPDFVNISDSGDMAYTYGKYNVLYNLNNTSNISSEGIFHTIWKRQNNNNWKFVYD